MACLIELYLQRNATPVIWDQFIKLIESNILRVENFGRAVRGRHSVNVYVRKSEGSAKKLLNLQEKFNRLIRNGSYRELVLTRGEAHYTLELPFLTDIGGTANCYEPDEPLVLKFLCSSYRADVKKVGSEYHSFCMRLLPNVTTAEFETDNNYDPPLPSGYPFSVADFFNLR